MPNPNIDTQINPPRLIPSFVAGFNAVASHLYIILIPVALDFFLWFGPVVRVKDLLLPAILRAMDISAVAASQEATQFIESSKQMYAAILENFNLLFILRTYPIGVPSLMIGQIVNTNPLGKPILVEVISTQQAALIILLCLAAGILLGSVYFSLIAAATEVTSSTLNDTKINKVSVRGIFWRTIQGLWLSIILLVAILAISMPLMCVFSALLFALPSLGMLPFTLFGILSVWISMPLVFSPHGIYTEQLNATRSIGMSIRLVRALFVSSGIFLLISTIMSYGLDILWSTPGAGSWMMIIGVFGHAFISSSLLASSFIFYQNGIRWLSEQIKSSTITTKISDV